jgi:hypothetical protein
MVTLPGSRRVYTSKDLQDDIKLAQAMLDRHGVKRRFTFARSGGVLYRLLEQTGLEVGGILSYSEWQEATRGNILNLGFALWKLTALAISREEEKTDGDSQSASPEPLPAGGDATDHRAARP